MGFDRIRNLSNNVKEKIKQFINWIKIYFRGILYIILLLVLSTYVIMNWDKCITMKFFEQFDGNNILFLIWLVLIILEFHDIEAKDFKIHRNMQRDYNSANSDFWRDMRNNAENIHGSGEANEGGNNSE